MGSDADYLLAHPQVVRINRRTCDVQTKPFVEICKGTPSDLKCKSMGTVRCAHLWITADTVEAAVAEAALHLRALAALLSKPAEEMHNAKEEDRGERSDADAGREHRGQEQPG